MWEMERRRHDREEAVRLHPGTRVTVPQAPRDTSLIPSCRHQISPTARQTDARPQVASGDMWGAGDAGCTGKEAHGLSIATTSERPIPTGPAIVAADLGADAA
jgi:hypothetical protein